MSLLQQKVPLENVRRRDPLLISFMNKVRSFRQSVEPQSIQLYCNTVLILIRRHNLILTKYSLDTFCCRLAPFIISIVTFNIKTHLQYQVLIAFIKFNDKLIFLMEFNKHEEGTTIWTRELKFAYRECSQNTEALRYLVMYTFYFSLFLYIIFFI